MKPYRAPWWLPGRHTQTIVPALLPAPQVRFVRERWETPDGDFIDVDFAGSSLSARTLVLFHGLEGNSSSSYARALAHAAAGQGWCFMLPHFRGCSGEINRLPRAYHSGDSVEIDWILRRAAARSEALYAAGVSLGGNALLKWLGEQSKAALAVVRRAAAVSAPINLAAAGDALDRGFNRQVYVRHFLSTMKRKSFSKLERHPGLFDASRLGCASTLREFDDTVTAPLHGFRDVDDYWERASSKSWLAHVQVPTLVINARNDPFLPEDILERSAASASAHVVLEFPRTGGHAGFLEGPFPGRHSWLPRRILGFLSSP